MEAAEAAQAYLLRERGPGLLVVNPGSSRLRVGLGSAAAPLEVAHVVAYARRGAAPAPDPAAPPNGGGGGAREGEREAACRQAEQALRLPPPHPRAQPPAEPAGEGAGLWAEPPADASVLHGDAVVALPPHARPAWHAVWPMRGGRLAVTAEQPLSRVLDAFEALLGWACATALALPPARLLALSAVLVVPATLSPREVRELGIVLLVRLGCRSLVVHTELQAVPFCLATPLAVVVVCGAHTTAVACVEEGAEVAGTRIVLPTGADDLAAALPALARRATGAALPDDSRVLAGLLAAHGLCLGPAGLAPGQAPPPADAPAVPWPPAGPGQPHCVRPAALGSAALLACCGLFAPRLLGGARAAVAFRPLRSLPAADAAACCEETFLVESGAAQVAASAEGMPEGAADGLGLDAALAASVIAASPKPDTRARLLASVLLAGGGSALPGLGAALEARCEGRLQDGAPVATHLAGPHAAWRGGALLAAADATRDAWLRRDAATDGVSVGRPGRYDAATTLVSKLAAYT